MTRAVIAYAIFAVVTFGHAANTIQPDFCNVECEDRKVAAAFCVSFVWPLYWSTRAWDAVLKGDV